MKCLESPGYAHFCCYRSEQELSGMHNLNRRSFLVRSFTTAALATFPNSPPWRAATAGESQAPTGDLIEHMTWLNEPASYQRVGDQLIVRSGPKTDFWRKTFNDQVADNGHFFHLSASGNFVFEARVNGNYASPSDQAGIMIRLDSENWMKCGTEFFAGQRQVSVVFTHDFSDWSLMKDLSDTAPIWWRAARHKNSIEVYCSLDGQNFTLVRSGYFVPSARVEVGVMCAAPEGPGFEAVFDHLKMSVEKG
jgi:uncharacterized protein